MCNKCFFNPIDNLDILLPTKPPSKKFKNWEEFIGANPGTTNRISGIQCSYKISSIFAPFSIEVNGCSGEYNTFTINGNWTNENDKYVSIPSFTNLFTPNLILDNEEKNT